MESLAKKVDHFQSVQRLLVKRHLNDRHLADTQSLKRNFWVKLQGLSFVDQILFRPNVCRSNGFRSKDAAPSNHILAEEKKLTFLTFESSHSAKVMTGGKKNSASGAIKRFWSQ
jgi:hypothetical protein